MGNSPIIGLITFLFMLPVLVAIIGFSHDSMENLKQIQQNPSNLTPVVEQMNRTVNFYVDDYRTPVAIVFTIIMAFIGALLFGSRSPI